MKNHVMIKHFPNGLNVLLDPDIPFDLLYMELSRKFNDSAKFFGNAKMVVSFEGRDLSSEEEKYLVDAICENTDLTVLCVLGKEGDGNTEYLKASTKFVSGTDSSASQFYRGTIRAGQVLETDSSIIILGDVNPGAEVASEGNIVILGTLYGIARAGIKGDNSCFIVSLDLKPSRIDVGEYTATINYKNGIWSKNKQAPKIAYVEDDGIKVDIITTALLNSLEKGQP